MNFTEFLFSISISHVFLFCLLNCIQFTVESRSYFKGFTKATFSDLLYDFKVSKEAVTFLHLNSLDFHFLKSAILLFFMILQLIILVVITEMDDICKRWIYLMGCMTSVLFCWSFWNKSFGLLGRHELRWKTIFRDWKVNLLGPIAKSE